MLLMAACVTTGSLAQLIPGATPTPTAEQVRRFDRNKNGTLEPQERRELEAEQARLAGEVEAAASTASEKVIELSPFEVTADSRGYFASNTLSGTRLNSKIEDLGASITVITKQQLLDTAALDINDVFLFEANTEGTEQFTDFTRDGQGRTVDNVQQNPMTSNRVRGLAAANITTDGFTSTSRIPFDAYNLESLELSRGPNASLAGLGDAGGSLNLNLARANLNRATTQIAFRGDDWGGFRTNFDVNRPIMKDKLAIRISAVYDAKGFRREPAQDIQRRLYGALTFKPFEKTTLSASVERFTQYRRTPNSQTPRDTVTEWIQAGKPTWDPVTFTAHLNGTSTVVPYAGQNNNGALPPGLGGDDFPYGFPRMFVEQGNVRLFTPNRLQTSGTNPTVFGAGNQRYVWTYPAINRYRAGGGLFTQPSISNIDLYDWENINFAALNWNRDKADLYTVKLDQKLFDTRNQRGYAQVAWRLEDSDNNNRNVFHETSFLYVDVNERLLDGSTNPFFLRPFIYTVDPTSASRPEYNDNIRGQLNYDLDFRQTNKRLSWLGRHRALGFYEARRVTTGNFSFREIIADDHAWLANRTNRANAVNYARIMRSYYLGDNQGFNVDQAPPISRSYEGTLDFRYLGNPATGLWTNEPTQVREVLNGANESRVEVHTRGASLQSFFAQDRLVTTFAIRKDAQRNRSRTVGAVSSDTGFFQIDDLRSWSAWTYREGQTKSHQAVLRPFNGWKPITGRRGQGGFSGRAADFLDGLSFHYNRSDSFRPASPNIDMFGNDLPNPNGIGKDLGFSVRMLDGKFVTRVNWYRTEQNDARVSGTAGQATNVARGLEVGTGPLPATASLEGWARNVITSRPSLAGASSGQIDRALYEFVQLPVGYYEDVLRGPVGVSDVNNQLSKGVEIELNYNPSRSLSFKLAAAQTQTIDSSLSEATQRWIDQRLPLWTSIKDDAGNLWWDNNNGQAQNFYRNQFVGQQQIARANLGKTRPQIKEWTWNGLVNYRFVGGRLNGLGLGASVRWADKSSIGYLGILDPATNTYTTLDPNRPVWDPSRTSYDFMASYNLRFFRDKVRARIQLNCRDAFANRSLRAIAVNPDGNPYNFRIVDGRRWILTTTFDL